MQVKSLETIRKKAELTEYRMAQMLGISQTNYQQIIHGTIKTPSSKVSLGALQIARNYTSLSLESALDMLSKDLGISADTLSERYNDNKKNKGASRK